MAQAIAFSAKTDSWPIQSGDGTPTSSYVCGRNSQAQEVEMEAEAEEAASSLSSGLRNASAKVFADEHGEGTEMIHEDPPLEDQNATLLEGAAGRPALIVSGMYGPAGDMGERGPAGPQGLQGPMGPAGASVIGPTGSQGTPGQQGKMGKTGKVGLKGHAGSQGEPGRGMGWDGTWIQVLTHEING